MRAWVVGFVVCLGGCGSAVEGQPGEVADGTSTGEATSEAGTRTGGPIPTTAESSGSVDESSGAADDSTGEAPADPCAVDFAMGLPHGRVYEDVDGTDRSRYAGGFEDEVDAPLEGLSIELLGSGLEPRASCPSGEFHFPADEGIYVLAPAEHPGPCSQRNCAARFPDAVSEGFVKIVTLGDSVPVVGAAETFPVRVAELVSAVADVDQVNLAISGTLSTDWTPGASAFEGARADLEDADVVLVSVGGNDVLDFASTVDLSDLGAALEGAQDTVDQVVANVLAIAEEIRGFNDDVDVVFCLYPDYTQATMTPPWSDLGVLPPGVVPSLLVRARDGIAAEDDIVLVDLFGLTPSLPEALDAYLDDPLHFNDLGHDLYAHEVFRSLGGVVVGESPLATEPVSDNRVDFGYLP